MRKRKPKRSPRPSKSRFKQFKAVLFDGRTLDLVLVIAAVAVVGYLGSLAWALSSGYSTTRPVTDDLVRLQIVDGIGDPALMKEIKQQIESIDQSQMVVELVSSERLNGRDIPRSLLISRLEENDPARKLAVRLGLTENDVLYRPLADNPSLISATLVVGEDFPRNDLP